MHFYQSYGLVFHSALALPELSPPAAPGTDVIVRFARIDRDLPLMNGRGQVVLAGDSETCLAWKGYGTFLVQDGKEILIDPAPGVEEAILRLLLLGPVLAVLLHQRGFLVLHASAVLVRDGAVAFLGPKGEGKSTMAAAMYARGHTLLADDIVAVGLDGTRNPTVPPGFPQFKLWPDSAASSLGDDPRSLPKLASGYDKRARRALDRFAHGSQPLRRIYLLETGTELSIEPLSMRAAIIQLIAHSYCSRYGSQLLYQQDPSSHFHQCSHVALRAPLYRLIRPRAMEALSDVADRVEAELANPEAIEPVKPEVASQGRVSERDLALQS